MTPSFFIIGAPKCGTTTLYSWLKSHPDIFMPEGKEPHFFAQNLSNRYCRVRNRNDYLSLFDEALDNQVCGEASVLYSFHPQAIEAILECCPSAQFIFMLRNPIDMALSYHRQLLINLEEDIQDFEYAWRLQEARKQGKHIPSSSTDPELLQYEEACSLGQHLQNIKNLIPEKQLHILFLDDIIDDPNKAYNDVLSFLEISPNYTPSFNKKNGARSVRFWWLQKLILNPPYIVRKLTGLIKKTGIPIGKIAHTLNRKKATKQHLNQEFKERLVDIFADDIMRIEHLTGRDLNHWKTHPP